MVVQEEMSHFLIELINAIFLFCQFLFEIRTIITCLLQVLFKSINPFLEKLHFFVLAPIPHLH